MMPKSKETVVYSDESYRILGACFNVYKEKGNGFLEVVYQECLAIEFDFMNVPNEQKKQLKLTYRSRELKHFYVPDFLCYGKIILEIKAVKAINDEHRAQVLNYLKSTGMKLGLLVNFGHYPKVEHERFVNEC